MSFIGSINEDLRAVLAGMAKGWGNLPVYVGCSGNFTVERLLTKAGTKEIHSNDVSLYSCTIGNHLRGMELAIGIEEAAEEEWGWLAKYMNDGVHKIATLLICSEMFKYADRNEVFHKRMLEAHKIQFQQMHLATVAKVKKALDGIRINSFFAGDIVDYVKGAPQECVFITFPPTYKAGYEKLYKKIDEVFIWERPEYQLFDEDGFNALVMKIMEKQFWVTLRDHEVALMSEHLRARIHTGMRSKPVFVYAAAGDAKVVNPHQKFEPVHLKRLEGELRGKIKLCPLSQGQLNTLRSEYLSPKIVPASAVARYAVLVGDELIGALAFDRSTFTGWCEAYMMTDFAIPSQNYKRLSKLVLAVAVSTEVKALLEMSMNMQIRVIGTTAFTERKVSQKYRGVFDLHSRKDGQLNYTGRAGRWSIEEGYAWWNKNHNPATQQLQTIA